jgi:hypothetical protein
MAAVNPEVNSVTAGYEDTGKSGRLPFDPPLLRHAVLSGLDRSGVNSLSLLEPGTGNYSIVKGLKKNLPIMGGQFAVGKYNKEYSDYRKVTAADWTNPTFQAQLVAAHQKGGGWSLLEKPLVCNSPLCVADGGVMIDGVFVAEVGYNTSSNSQQLRDVYPAMNLKTKVAWTTEAPELGNNWTVTGMSPYSNPPCLFVHESYNSAPAGGSRRSRRHKRRNYVKKQKKRTRKH